MAERWNTRLSRVFDHKLRGRQVLVLYASHADFEQTTVIQDELGEGTGGSPNRSAVASSCHSAGHWPTPIMCSDTNWFTRSSTTSPRAVPGNRQDPDSGSCRCGS
jgi:hypothetical protein